MIKIFNPIEFYFVELKILNLCSKYLKKSHFEKHPHY